MMESFHDVRAMDDVGGSPAVVRKKPKKVDQSVVDQIMDGLRDGQPRKTLELAKFCGFQTKQEINPTLYYMQKQRLLAKVSMETWRAIDFLFHHDQTYDGRSRCRYFTT